MADGLNEDTGRSSVPLMMIDGNLEVLLKGPVFCNAVSLKHYDRGVVLVFHLSEEQKAAAREQGFTFKDY